MIRYLKKAWSDFLNSKPITKALFALFLAVYIFTICICTIKVDYEILTPGVVNDASLSVKVNREDPPKDLIGTIGIYVHIKVPLIQYWLSVNNDQFAVSEYYPDTQLDNQADTQFGIISKKVGINNAIIAAYEAAKKYEEETKGSSNINIVKVYEGKIVSAIFPYSKTDLLTDDIITHVNGVEVLSTNNAYYEEVLKSKANNTNPVFTVKRKSSNKDEYITKDVSAEFVMVDNNLLMGIATYDYYTIVNKEDQTQVTTPSFEIIDNYSSIGSSGSAMLALSIFNDLIEEDITKGKFIVGTGTIEIDGTIGAISGVEQKVLTAHNYKVDIFFIDDVDGDTPSDYDLAIQACKKHNIDDNFLVPVKTFSDIIKHLQGLED